MQLDSLRAGGVNSACERDRDSLRPKTPILLVGAIFLLHALGIVLSVDHPRFWFTSHPILDADWGLHYHHLKSLAGFMQSDHRLWGYNPYFMAGYPSNTIQDVSIKLFEFAAIALPGLDVVQAFKLSVLLFTAIVPWICYLTYRHLFGGTRAGAVVAAGLGTMYWWNSHPREMFFYGMIGFPIACYVALLAPALLRRALTASRAFSAAAAAFMLTVAILLPLHLQGALVAFVPCLLLAVARRRLDRLVVAFAAAGVALVVNGAWLVPLVTHLKDDASATIVAQLPLYNSTDWWTWFKDYFTTEPFWTDRDWPLAERALRVAVTVLGIAGIVALFRHGKRDIAAALAATASLLFAMTYFGSFVEPLAAWQPLRFRIALDVVMIIAASYALASTGAAAAGPRLRQWKTWVIAAGVLGCALNVIATERAGKMRLETEFKPPATEVVRWLYSVVPKSGRILFEESGDETDFAYSHMYLSAFLPHITGQQLIGGPINLCNDRHHFAEFHSAQLFKRGVASFSEEELRGYFDLYNIIAVVAFHPASVRRFGEFRKLLSPLERSGDVWLFRVNREANWFLSGTGEVTAGWNRITCSRVEGRNVVLKYHWVEGLSAEPPISIRPVAVPGDPIPFIGITDPPAQFAVSITTRP